MGVIKFFGSGVRASLKLDPDYKKVYDYARQNSISLPDKKIIFLQNKLVIDLKSLGVFQKWDTFHMGVNNSDDGKAYAQINWVNPDSTNFLNSAFDVPWDKLKGFGGSTASNAEWRCAYSQINYRLTDASIFCHVNTLTSSGSNIVIRGGLGPSSSDGLIQTANLTAQRINQGNTNLSGTIDMTGVGHKLLFRINNTDVIGWNNLTRTARTRATLSQDGAYVVMGRGNTSYISCGGMGASFDSLSESYQSLINKYFIDINSI